MAYQYINLDLLNELTGGDESFLREIVDSFTHNTREDHLLLLEAVRAGNVAAAGACAHKMKSASLAMGVEMLGQLAHRLEAACKLNNPDLILIESLSAAMTENLEGAIIEFNKELNK